MTSGAARLPHRRPPAVRVFPRRQGRSRLRLALLGLACLVGVRASPAWAQTQDDPTIEDLLEAVVALESRIPPSARTARILGTERQGSGVVIGGEGLILTIGYLILEAERVEVTLQDGTRLPAAVVGYDPNSGFGVVRTLKPVAARPPRLGQAAALRREDPVLIVVGGPGDERVHSAVVVSRRVFAGYWEYMLERALFTSPPVESYAGAALFDKDLRLVGIGSLVVRDASEGADLPGNMFVPVDELGALLPESGEARALLGAGAALAGRVAGGAVRPRGGDARESGKPGRARRAARGRYPGRGGGTAGGQHGRAVPGPVGTRKRGHPGAAQGVARPPAERHRGAHHRPHDLLSHGGALSHGAGAVRR